MLSPSSVNLPAWTISYSSPDEISPRYWVDGGSIEIVVSETDDNEAGIFTMNIEGTLSDDISTSKLEPVIIYLIAVATSPIATITHSFASPTSTSYLDFTTTPNSSNGHIDYSIDYTIELADGSPAPSWITIDPATNMITVDETDPNAISGYTYDFLLRGTILGYVPTYSETVPFTVNLFVIEPEPFDVLEYPVGCASNQFTFPEWTFDRPTSFSFTYTIEEVGGAPITAAHSWISINSASRYIQITTSDQSLAGVYQF